jgi:NAD(P)-dependent dehydrogenase (short-subunit alcohol dehydrogenase family)
MSPRELTGRTAIVTCAASGIGRATAESLASAGARVAAVDLSPPIETVDSIQSAGGTALAVEADVADHEAVLTAAATVERELDTPNLLVTAAGIVQTSDSCDVLALTEAEWRRVIDVNLAGTFFWAQAVARGIVSASIPGGSIVTIATTGAVRPPHGTPAYHASKGGVISLTRALAVNLARHHIRVNSVLPGTIDTRLTHAELDVPEIAARIRARTPAGRPGDPREVASAITFLASDDASYITGQTLIVDGGLVVQGWTDAG